MSTEQGANYDSYCEEIVIIPCFVKLTRLTVIEVGPDEEISGKHPPREQERRKKKEPKRNRGNIIQTGRKIKTCIFCAKPVRIENFLRHLLMHTGERPHLCKYCDETFTYTHDLNRHHRRVHLKIKPCSYKCAHCEKSFSGRQNLTRHVRVEHQGHRFQCPLCSQSCGYQHNLKSHIHKFHNVKPESLSDILKLAKHTSTNGSDGNP